MYISSLMNLYMVDVNAGPNFGHPKLVVVSENINAVHKLIMQDNHGHQYHKHTKNLAAEKNI